jgi:hypothetical protein
MFQQFQLISKISTTKKIWNCRDCHDQIWIYHFDHENIGIFGMVMGKIGLTILTIETQFWPNDQKIVVIRPPTLHFQKVLCRDIHLLL